MPGYSLTTGVVQSAASELVLDDEKQLYDGEDSVERKSESVDVNERKLLRKIDLRLVPVLCILYLLAFLDRCVCVSGIERWLTDWSYTGLISPMPPYTA